MATQVHDTAQNGVLRLALPIAIEFVSINWAISNDIARVDNVLLARLQGELIDLTLA